MLASSLITRLPVAKNNLEKTVAASIARELVPRLIKLALVTLLVTLLFGWSSRADGGLTVIITDTILMTSNIK